MDFPASLFPLPMLWLCNGVMFASLLHCARRLAWRTLDRQVLNAWIGACVLVMALWALRDEYRPGLSFHLLGMAILSLMMGARRGLLGAALVIAGAELGRGSSLLPLGLDWLLSGALPVLFTRLVLWFTQRYLPANYFVYLFLNAFLAGGLSMALSGCAGLLLLGVAGAHEWAVLFDDAMPYYLLLSWSEAFISGLVLAVLVVYRPGWVASFDDARYLADRMDDF